MSAKAGLARFLEQRAAFLDSITRGVGAVANAASTARVPASSPFALAPGSDAAAPVTLRLLMAAGAHIGHAPARWHPRMAPYVHGERAGVHVLDLEKTAVCLRRAARALMALCALGGPSGSGAAVLWLGTSRGQWMRRLVYECASAAGHFYVNTRWLGGTLTNRAQVVRSARLLPDMLVVLDPRDNAAAVAEAQAEGVPTIGICDSDCDPAQLTYPVPANDDAHASVRLVAAALCRAAIEGQRTRSASAVAAAAAPVLRADPRLQHASRALHI